MKVAHIISGLGTGGAEHMLLKLIISAENRSDILVISLTGEGELGKSFVSSGVNTLFLNFSFGITSIKDIYTLYRELKSYSPDIVQTWMYHADLVGGIVARLSGCENIVWNIRNSDLDKNKTKFFTRLTMNICSLLSYFIPKYIVSNSERSIRIHEDHGYAKKFKIIPNGFDTTKFRPSVNTNQSLRKKFGISRDDYVIGMAARFDPQKNHEGFLRAAYLLKESRRDVKFILCGTKIDTNNQILMGWLETYDLRKSVILMGKRRDMEQITSMFDIACLSSIYGEAFPNVIGEAMAVGVPCVVTDVGDSALVVGDTGVVVPPDDPAALADAWDKVLSMPEEERKKLGQHARQRIEDNFSIKKITLQYESFYQELVSE